MKLFGVTEVLADQNYGTVEYVTAATKHIGLKEAPITLEATQRDGVLSIKPVVAPN